MSKRASPSSTRRRRGIRKLRALISTPLGWRWLGNPPSSSRPRILISLGRTLWNRLGGSRFTYLRAIRQAGGVAVPSFFSLEAQATDLDDHSGAFPTGVLDSVIDEIDGLLLSGGGDVDPARYGGDHAWGEGVVDQRDHFEFALLERAVERGLPVLGVCRGAQLLNVACGGSLRNLRLDPELRRRHRSLRGHAVWLDPASDLARIFQTSDLRRVTTIHGQAVDRLGDGLRSVGWSKADEVVEAIEASAPDASFAMGVQWHPELMHSDVFQRRLFAAFVRAADRTQAMDADEVDAEKD